MTSAAVKREEAGFTLPARWQGWAPFFDTRAPQSGSSGCLVHTKKAGRHRQYSHLTAVRLARMSCSFWRPLGARNDRHRLQERQHAGVAGVVDVVLKPRLRSIPVSVLVEGQRRYVLRLHCTGYAGEDQAGTCWAASTRTDNAASSSSSRGFSPTGNVCTG